MANQPPGGSTRGAPGPQPWRNTFVRRAPLRFAVIAIAMIWSIPTRWPAGHVCPCPQGHRTRTGGWEALLSPLDFTQWTLQNWTSTSSRVGRGHGDRVHQQPHRQHPGHGHPHHDGSVRGVRVRVDALPLPRTPSPLFILVVGLLVVPLQMALIPASRSSRRSVCPGQFLGIWLAHTGFGLPLAVFLLYNFISQLPEDLFETASIDGATHFQMFTRIVLPLSVPALAAFAIFQFLWVWNDLLVALVFLGPQQDVAPATVALNQLVGNRGEQWHILTAGAFVTMIVPLVVFLALQRYFVRGILSGSVKGAAEHGAAAPP